MAISQAKRAANARWDKANRHRYYRPSVILPKAMEEAVKEQAKPYGGISPYIRCLIQQDIDGHNTE